MARYMRERRNRRRNQLIELAGGKCVKCSSVDELQFDHRDRATKLFILSGSNLDRNWKTIMEEFAKCDLLCWKCHRIKSKECDDNGYQNRRRKRRAHGSEAMYIIDGCRCDDCRLARKTARTQRRQSSLASMADAPVC